MSGDPNIENLFLLNIFFHPNDIPESALPMITNTILNVQIVKEFPQLPIVHWHNVWKPFATTTKLHIFHRILFRNNIKNCEENSGICKYTFYVIEKLILIWDMLRSMSLFVANIFFH